MSHITSLSLFSFCDSLSLSDSCDTNDGRSLRPHLDDIELAQALPIPRFTGWTPRAVLAAQHELRQDSAPSIRQGSQASIPAAEQQNSEDKAKVPAKEAKTFNIIPPQSVGKYSKGFRIRFTVPPSHDAFANKDDASDCIGLYLTSSDVCIARLGLDKR